MAARFGYAALVVALAAPLAAFVTMLNAPSLDPLIKAPTAHFYIVSAATLLSAIIGTALALSVESVRTTRTVFLAVGFIAVAMIFATHGLGTPGFIVSGHEYPYAVIISAGLSMTVGALFIALSVLPTHWPGSGFVARHSTTLLGVALALLTGYLASMVVRPQTWDFLPTGKPWNTVLAATTVAMLGFAAWRYLRAWNLTRLPGQMAMVCALVLLAEGQVSMYYGTLWHLSWWLYHGLLLVAFSTLIVGWAVEAWRAKSLVVFSRAIELRDGLDRVRSTATSELEALESAMQDKDEYTRHHMGRVAEYAGAIARKMHLPEETIEVVETAGRVHDIGKIAVPDAVLTKPGRLTPEEFALIKNHCEKGEHITRRTRVLAHVALVVRAHHERFAGGGYPDGTQGEAIPLEARIVAVADTFDALTSNRVYRAQRSFTDAVAELWRVRGSQLDPQCVQAFFEWLVESGQLQPGEQDRLAA
jgi:HD-GYP domain-containing protein (c-di-GMP phosphodiesterase class II)